MNKQNIRPIRRVLAAILSLALLLTFTPLSGMVTLTAGALDDSVTYIDADGTLQTITEYNTVKNYDGQMHKTWKAGNYVVRGNVTINVTGRAAVLLRETVNLILCDGALLTVNSTNSCAFTGIGEKLNIFAQSTGSSKGKLTATGDTGVECESLNVYGGEVTFEGTSYGLHLDGNNDSEGLTVNGGDVRIVNNTDDQTVIYAESSIGHVTVDGGKLTVSGSGGGKAIEYIDSIAFNDGTANITGNITDFSTLALNGGNVTIKGGLGGFDEDASDNEVILDYQRPTDKYKITNLNKLSDKNDYTVKVAENKAVSVDGTTYSGTLTDAQRAAISGKDITPFFGKVTVADGITGGTVTASKTNNLIYGDTVTLTVTPKTGYTGGTVTVRDSNNNVIEVNNNQFKMPASDVTVSATFTPDSAYFSQDGDTYTIHDAAGWDVFCDMLAENDKGIFTGKTVTLADDITVSRMAGGSHHDFTGTFEGNYKVLTFNYDAEAEYAAPFRYVETGCEIKNLHVNGTITTDNKYAAGIIARQYGTVTIRNCRSSVNIQSSVKGDGTHAGLVAVNNKSADLTIEGCVFDGKIVSTGTGDDATTSCGGFVGWRDKNGSLTITDSLYAPTADDNAVADGATFARNGSAGANCYYTAALGTAQGKQAYTITPGADVTLDLSGTPTEYNVSGINVYSSGIEYNGNLYAGSEDTVELSLNYTGTPAAGYTVKGYTASAGTLSGSTLTMPAEDVTINANFDVESTFDASTGTLTLKGTIHNNKGIVLPDGVNKAAVLHINVDSNGATLPQDSSYLFSYFDNVTSIDLTGADTRNVTNMSCMFSDCYNLTELDLSSFDTGNVTNMNCMFENCESLTELDLSSFDTSSVTNMNGMFSDCYNLTELDLSSFDTSRVSDMISMFLGCYLLKTIYVSEQWSTESVIDSTDMFRDCFWLTGGNGTAYNGSKTDREYACIDKDGQPGYLTGTYAVTVPAGITISPVNAIIDSVPFYVKGETITISPREGYIIADAFVFLDLGYDLIEIDITDNNDGTYSFTMPENNVSMEVVTAFTDGIGAALAGHSISLKGDIAVNFYMDLDPEIAQSETAYMQFTIPNGSTTEIKTMPVRKASEEGGYYIFKCSVAAKDMNSIIKAQIFDGNGNPGTEYTYSVRRYADYLLAHTRNNADYAKAAPIVRAMLHYGAAAQGYFGSTSSPANTDIESNGWENVTAQTINKPYDRTTESLPAGVTFEGVTLSLRSQTTLSLYFKSDQPLEFSCAGMTVETKAVGEYCVARIRDIPARLLSHDFTLSLGGDYQVTYSPLNYCYNVLNDSSQPDSLRHVAQTLYLYSQAADAYFTE